MRAREIADVNIVANAGTVGRRIIVAEHIELGAQAEGCFDRDLDQMRRRFARLTGAAERIGAGHIEVAQNDMIESVRATGVAQHHFAHQLRPAVRRDRLRAAFSVTGISAGLP